MILSFFWQLITLMKKMFCTHLMQPKRTKEFNDKLQFISDSFRTSQKLFWQIWNCFYQKIDTIRYRRKQFEIIKWETAIGKRFIKTNLTNLIPVHHLANPFLNHSLQVGYEQAHNLKLKRLCTNFLKKNGNFYGVWLDQLVYEKRVEKGRRNKSLTIKMIPQFESMITDKVEDNLFFILP
jgi:hypothetical protein